MRAVRSSAHSGSADAFFNAFDGFLWLHSRVSFPDFPEGSRRSDRSQVHTRYGAAMGSSVAARCGPDRSRLLFSTRCDAETEAR